MLDFNDIISAMQKNGFNGFGFIDTDTNTSSSPFTVYSFKLGDTTIKVYNTCNKKLEIDGLQFQLDYNRMTVNVENNGLKQLSSIDDLKHTVKEYRRVYKQMLETVKKLQIEEDFCE
jgi:hypothetical protein